MVLAIVSWLDGSQCFVSQTRHLLWQPLFIQYHSLGFIETGRWIGTKKEQRLWTLKITEGLFILKQFYLYIIRNIVVSQSETFNLISNVNNPMSVFVPIHLPVPIHPKLQYSSTLLKDFRGFNSINSQNYKLQAVLSKLSCLFLKIYQWISDHYNSSQAQAIIFHVLSFFLNCCFTWVVQNFFHKQHKTIN